MPFGKSLAKRLARDKNPQAALGARAAAALAALKALVPGSLAKREAVSCISCCRSRSRLVRICS
eukprot:4395715-Alexandrium_andersonii.AAC.1